MDEKVSPRFGVIVKPNRDLSIYASYAESFLPQAGDQFLVLSPTSAQFEPEKFTNYEIGFKFAPLAKVLVSAAVFRPNRSSAPRIFAWPGSTACSLRSSTSVPSSNPLVPPHGTPSGPFRRHGS